jgi:hypothetical protein
MRPRDQEPVQKDIERVIKGEESTVVSKPDVPDDVKAEALERLDRFEDIDSEHERE